MVSKLSQMQARFQQKQMQEKEEKLLRLYENQQQRTIERVNRGSAGSNTSGTSVTSVTPTQGGKVRQMFDERRQKAGIDRSYPLEPLRTVTNKTIVSRTSAHIKNGKPLVNKREVVQTYYNNNNGDEYFEERRYDHDNANAPSNYGRILNKTFRPRDLEILMNDHHIQDNLDDEEFPDMSFDDIDESVTRPTDLVRESPLQSGTVKHDTGTKAYMVNGNTSPVKTNSPKKEVKTTVRKAVLHTSSSVPNSSPLSPNSGKVVSNIKSPPRTPEKSASVKMSSKFSAKKSADMRTPSATRPAKSSSGAVPSMVARDDLTECRYCSRRFASDRITAHEDICAKTAKKKRKVYDATKHRVQGTELEPYARKVGKSVASKQKATPAKKTDWRRKHEEFISAIRAAKMVQEHVAKGGKLSDLPPPPPSYNPDYVQCPHCGRRFNESAAARHIPKCVNYNFNKSKSQTRPGGASKSNFK